MTGVAFLGCGLVAAKRASALPEGFESRAVYDLDTHKAEAFAQRLEAPPRVTLSPQEALESGVGLAIVATYHRDLAPLSLMAIEAGCHVLIEKPAGRTPAELTELRQRASARGLTVRVGYNHRFHPSVHRAKKLIEGGSYGDVISIRARYGHGGRVGYEAEWRADRQLSGGGELLDQGVHLIDLVRFFVGNVTLAFAELRTDFWNCDVEDNAYLALRPERGGFAWIHASWTEWKNLFSFEIAMHRAKIEIHGLGGSYGTERLTLYEMLPEMGPPRTSSWEWPFPDHSWALETADVVSAIRGAQAVGADLNDAIAALDIVQNAYSGRAPENTDSPLSATNWPRRA